MIFEIGRIIKELEEAWANAPVNVFHTKADVEALEEDRALAIMRFARRALVLQLLHQEHHEHMTDDCGDYLFAALDNFRRIFDMIQDWGTQGIEERMKEWLLEGPEEWLGCDGEIRFDLFTEDYIEEELPNV